MQVLVDVIEYQGSAEFFERIRVNAKLLNPANPQLHALGVAQQVGFVSLLYGPREELFYANA